jgi:hypothetical protein
MLEHDELVDGKIDAEMKRRYKMSTVHGSRRDNRNQY